MSEAPAAPTAVAVPAADTVPTPVTETTPAVASTTATTEETAAPAVPEKDTVPAVAPAVIAAEAAPAAAAADIEPKPVEPVTEGHLGYKAPGLLKQFTFAKKDFWFSDEPVSPEHLNLYLRGEKAEIAHPVVAWASQSGKGLLFFVKKSETTKAHPAGVIALYDATDLRKTSPHEFAFRLHNQNHSFKASSETERDGWYVSIEKAIEIGKANKETVRESEGYKAEIAKLNTPNVVPAAAVPTVAAVSPVAAGTAAAAAVPGDVETEETKRANSSEGEELKKKNPNNKSRSTSRGFVNRLMGKKDEVEHKLEEKKEEKKIEHEEKKIEKEEKKADVAPAVVAAAPVETTKTEEPVEPVIAAATTTEEKPKASKRNSIFGTLKASLKSPTKEKEHKDAELKSETGVSDVPPQLPETAVATEPTVIPTIAAVEPASETAAPKVEEEKAVQPETISTPNREKKTFLSGISFINKRDRSVSPSAASKETAATEAKPAETTAATTETPVVAATSEEKAEEKAEETPVANKRQSVLGGLGRRASKMIQRVQPNKKETTAPAAATTTGTSAAAATEAKAAEEETAVTEVAPITAPTTIAPAAVSDGVVEDKPEPITTAAPPAVTASA